MGVKIVSPSGTWVQPPNHTTHPHPTGVVNIDTPSGVFKQPPNKPFPPHHPHPTVLPKVK